MDIAVSEHVPRTETASRLPLSVAFVTETYPPEINGVAHTVSHLVRGLADRGHDVQVIRPGQGRDDRTVDDAAIPEVVTAGLPIPGYRQLRMGLPAGRRLRRRWQARRPDVIYIATEGPLGRSALAAARRLSIPVVSGFHTNFDAYTKFYRVGFIESVVLGYLRRFHNRCQGTLVPTAELAHSLESKGFQRVAVMARGVDTERFQPGHRDAALRREWGVGDDALAVLFVGRVAAEKNIRLAIAAFEAIEHKHPGARFVVVGDGPLRQRLQAEYPRFVFRGARRGLDLARHYASADLFVFGSTSETYGNVIIEAMASGLPVVCYDYAAGHQHIRPGDNGLLAPLDDAAAFVHQAVRLAGDRERAHEIGRHARTTAEALAWDRILDRFEEALRTAMDAAHAR